MKLKNLIVLCLVFLTSGMAFAQQGTANIKCYGIGSDHELKSAILIEPGSNQSVSLLGTWGKSELGTEYFTLNKNNFVKMESLCRDHLIGVNPETIQLYTTSSSFLPSVSEVPVVSEVERPIDDVISAFDMREIWELSMLARLAYAINDPGRYKGNMKYLPEGKYVKVAEHNATNWLPIFGNDLDAIAFKNTEKTKTTIIISFKGTDFRYWFGFIPNFTDLRNDFAIFSGLNFLGAFNEAEEFYEEVRSEYPDAEIILTGDSLGGYFAAHVAAVTGELARVFSAPGVLPRDYVGKSFLSEGITFNNIINFAREGDPVVGFRNHAENVIYFEGGKTCEMGPIKCHAITEFEKMLREFPNPTYADIRANAELGHGLKKAVHHIGPIGTTTSQTTTPQ